MKHNYTDTQLQAAINGACDKLAQSTRVYLNALDLDNTTESWPVEAPARLDLIKSALASLPEPEPPTVDGKTPGEFYSNLLSDSAPDEYYSWAEMSSEMRAEMQSRLAAVLAAFGKQSQPAEEANARAEKAEAELARIIESAHEAGWNGVENPKDLAQFIKRQAEELTQSRSMNSDLIKDKLTNQSSLSQLRPISEAGPVPEGCVRYHFSKYGDDIGVGTIAKHPSDVLFADIRLPELAKTKENGLSQLRPLSEAGEVPEGYVRYYTYKKDGEWTTESKHRAMQDTHYIDIRLPESSEKHDPYAELKAAHAAEKVIQCKLDVVDDFWEDMKDPRWGAKPHEYRIKPEPEPLATKPILPPTWTPKVGDVVTLKSGGPKMTVMQDIGHNFLCAYDSLGEVKTVSIPTNCLQPA